MKPAAQAPSAPFSSPRGPLPQKPAPVASDSAQGAAERPLTVLAPDHYPWRFNGPTRSTHRIVAAPFVPFNHLSNKIEGFTVFPTGAFRRIDLIHAFNRIPVSRRPFVIGFESHMPRAFGMQQTILHRALTQALVSDRCRAIVAISDYARHIFLRQHARHPDRSTLERKLLVRYPALDLPLRGADEPGPFTPMRLLFVGNHFARKGGCVALRFAEIAARLRLPVRIDLVSALTVGAPSWTDPPDSAYFERYWRLLSLPNVVAHGPLPNAETRALMRQAHFVLLPTLGDTFGYSALEALAEATPVVATAQGALPEFIADGVNGFLLPLPLSERREWIHLGRTDRASAAFARVHHETIETLAWMMLDRLQPIFDDPARHAAMRLAARRTAFRRFDAGPASAFWDRLYVAALAEAPLAAPSPAGR